MTAAFRERPTGHGQDDMIASHRAAPARAGTGTRTRSGAARPRTTRKAATRPKLRVLNQQAIRQRARRRNALLALFIVVLCGFFAVALIQAQLVADQQDLDVLRARIAEAEADNAKMARDIELASSPAAIVGRATEFGMVRAYQPVYLQAVAPIRELPNAPVFDPATENRFTLAAPQAASAATVTAGLMSTAPVSPVEVQIATGTTTSPAPAPVSAELVGTQVSADQGPAGASVASAADGGSRFAGTRAVTGGPGSG